MKKPRKPKPLGMDGPVFCAAIERTGVGKGRPYVLTREGYHCSDQYLTEDQCRKLGNWLLSAADYMESRKK